MKKYCPTAMALFLILVLAPKWALSATTKPEPVKPGPPPKVQPGFFQEKTYACYIETNISPEYSKKVADMVRRAEEKFYKLFKLTPDLMQGWAKEKFDVKNNIPGTIMTDIGIRPWIDIKVYKDEETMAGRMVRAHARHRPSGKRRSMGLPGAYFSLGPDSEYDQRAVRKIRSFVSNRDDEELERTILHEMGHCFVESYMLAFAQAKGSRQAGDDKRLARVAERRHRAIVREDIHEHPVVDQGAPEAAGDDLRSVVKIKRQLPVQGFRQKSPMRTNLKAVAWRPASSHDQLRAIGVGDGLHGERRTARASSRS